MSYRGSPKPWILIWLVTPSSQHCLLPLPHPSPLGPLSPYYHIVTAPSLPPGLPSIPHHPRPSETTQCLPFPPQLYQKAASAARPRSEAGNLGRHVELVDTAHLGSRTKGHSRILAHHSQRAGCPRRSLLHSKRVTPWAAGCFTRGFASLRGARQSLA